MSCFICLEDTGKMVTQGCLCKGSISVHETCFKNWCSIAVDPFTCCICKASLSPVLLVKYMGLEKIMFFSKEKSRPQIVEYYMDHGVLFQIKDGKVLFRNEKDMCLYTESSKRELDGIKKANRFKAHRLF